MKRTIAILSLFISISAAAQTDSTQTRNLGEVVVDADVATTSAEKSVFYPTQRQRNTAMSATDLLGRMMIPLLSVDPMSGSVTTSASEPVTIFIDYVPANAEDLAGMNTTDVLRVEVLENPTDVRFLGKQHVVHFIMQQYAFGGYTKANASSHFLADFQTSGNIYSKLATGNWTIDMNIADLYAVNRHIGTNAVETFRLPDIDIIRTEEMANGHMDYHNPSASLRAMYKTDRVQLSNRVEILHENMPRRDVCGTVGYSVPAPSLQSSVSHPATLSPITTESHRSNAQLTTKYDGNWFFALPHDWALTFNPGFWLAHNDVNRFYREGDTPAIIHDINEDAHQLSLVANVSRTFGQHHTLILDNSVTDYHSIMDYSVGTKSRVQQLTAISKATYRYHTEHLNISADLFGKYMENRINGESNDKWMPSFGLHGSYSPSSHHRFGFDAGINIRRTNSALQNPNILQENELMYYSGNPSLRDFSETMVGFLYTWMPSNTFMSHLFVHHFFDKDYISNVYEHYYPAISGGENPVALLCTPANVGDQHTTSIAAVMTLRLLDNRLLFQFSPTWTLYRTSGEYANHRKPFRCTGQAVYYMGNFYVMGYVASDQTIFDREGNAWHDELMHTQLSVGWGNARWKARIDLCNPLRMHWRSRHVTIDTPNYISTVQHYDFSKHQGIFLQLSYTFNYGKKVSHDNELDSVTSGQSSVL